MKGFLECIGKLFGLLVLLGLLVLVLLLFRGWQIESGKVQTIPTSTPVATTTPISVQYWSGVVITATNFYIEQSDFPTKGDGSLAQGAEVQVAGRTPDCVWLLISLNGVDRWIEAAKVQVVKPVAELPIAVLATATNTPEPTVITTNTPLPTSTTAPTDTSTALPTATNTVTPTATVAPTNTPMATATLVATQPPAPTATQVAVSPLSPLPTPTSTALAASPLPSPNPTLTPVPPATSTSTALPVPTNTDTPVPPTKTATSTALPAATATPSPVPTATATSVVPPTPTPDPCDPSLDEATLVSRGCQPAPRATTGGPG